MQTSYVGSCGQAPGSGGALFGAAIHEKALVRFRKAVKVLAMTDEDTKARFNSTGNPAFQCIHHR